MVFSIVLVSSLAIPSGISSVFADKDSEYDGYCWMTDEIKHCEKISDGWITDNTRLWLGGNLDDDDFVYQIESLEDFEDFSETEDQLVDANEQEDADELDDIDQLELEGIDDLDELEMDDEQIDKEFEDLEKSIDDKSVSDNTVDSSEFSKDLPDWVKAVAAWLDQGQIEEDEFLQGVLWLLNH